MLLLQSYVDTMFSKKYCRDLDYIVSAGNDGDINFWDARDGEWVQSYEVTTSLSWVILSVNHAIWFSLLILQLSSSWIFVWGGYSECYYTSPCPSDSNQWVFLFRQFSIFVRSPFWKTKVALQGAGRIMGALWNTQADKVYCSLLSLTLLCLVPQSTCCWKSVGDLV